MPSKRDSIQRQYLMNKLNRDQRAAGKETELGWYIERLKAWVRGELKRSERKGGL